MSMAASAPLCGRFESDATSSLATSNLRSARVGNFATVAIFLSKLQAASPVCGGARQCLLYLTVVFFAKAD